MDVKFLTGTDIKNVPTETVGQVYFVYDVPAGETKTGEIYYDSPNGRVKMHMNALNDGDGQEITKTYVKKIEVQQLIIETLYGMSYDGDYDFEEEF